MDELLKAINGVFKSYEFFSYVENPKNYFEMDEYDYMMKPIWEKLKEEYDKAKMENNHEIATNVCKCDPACVGWLETLKGRVCSVCGELRR